MKKIKILIVDDEKPARVVLRYLIEDSSLADFSILEAKNGSEGLNLFHEHTPDIVILDINMPHMNGIDFLEKIENHIGTAKIIIISGYNEFAFAQKAIQYNVVGYLLKPIHDQEFYKVLEKAVMRFLEDSSVNEKLSKLQEEMLVEYLTRLLHGAAGETGESWRVVQTDLSRYKNFKVNILRWNNSSGVRERNDDCLPEVTDQKIRKFVQDFYENKCNAICFETGKYENILIVYGYENELQLKNTLHMLQIAFFNQFGLKLLYAEGTEQESVEDIFVSYCDAKRNIGQINILNEGQEADVITESKSEDNKNFLREYWTLIKNCYVKNKDAELNNIIKTIINQIEKTGYFTLSQAELLIRQYILYIDEFFVSNGENKASVLYISDWQFRLSRITSFQVFEELLFWITQNTIGKLKKREYDLDWTLEDIRHYLETEYAQDLVLEEFAKKYCYNKQYLNKMFKKKYGCSIHEYQLKIQMEHAKDLLLNTKMEIGEIAFSVGYSNQGYFGKIFRRYYHASPSSFRKTQDE